MPYSASIFLHKTGVLLWGMLVIVGFLSPNLNADTLTTKIIYVDQQNNYVVFDKGTADRIFLNSRVCLNDKSGQQIYCGAIENSLKTASFYHVPQSVLAKINIGAEASYETPLVQLDKKISSDTPSRWREITNKIELHEPARSLGVGLLITPQAPVVARSLFFKPPVKRTDGVNSSLWQTEGAVTRSKGGGFITCTGSPYRYFNLVYDGYFRFFDQILDEQNNIPANTNSYVTTEFKQNAMGLGMGAAFKKLSLGFVSVSPQLLAEIERSSVEFKALVYDKDSVATLATAKSQIYVLLMKADLELMVETTRWTYGVSYGLLFPLHSSSQTRAHATMPPASDIVTYSDDTSTDIKEQIDHRTARMGQEIRMIVSYKLN